MQEQIQDILRRHLGEYLSGEAADLEAFVQQITADGAEAAAIGRQDLIKELGHQARTRGEAMRLRASAAGWATIGDIITVGFSTLLAGLQTSQ
jgi:hypothetical protein